MRSGLVSRPALVGRLIAAAEQVPLAALVAPPGYGKTTLLAEWAEVDERPFAWVRVEDADNDPLHLLGSIAHALDPSEPVDPDVFTALSAPRPRAFTDVLPRLARCLAERERPVVLVLDDAHVLRARRPVEALTTVFESLGPGSQLAISGRALPPLPTGRLRAHREVVELRSEDFAMVPAEAAVLLRTVGHDLDPSDVEVLVERTEGWPAALYLAALSLHEQGDARAAVAGFGGHDRLISEYLRHELLSALSPEHARFLVRTSIVETLSGPLCDAILGRPGSAGTLAELAGVDVLLVHVDRGGERYRHHRLVADMLRAELRRTEPERMPSLHARASAWHAGHGDAEPAIRHAVAAGDATGAGPLLWAGAATFIAEGRNDAIRGWLGAFAEAQIAACPELALTAAAVALADGDGSRAARWLSAAGGAEHRPDGAPGVSAGLALIRAGLARDGLVRMGNDAARASELELDGSPRRALSCLYQGVAYHLMGTRDRARARLEEGARRGALAAMDAQALCLAQLALMALEDGDREAAEAFVERATAQITRWQLAEYPTMALAFAVSALAAAHLGRVEHAERDLRHALTLAGRLTEFAPWYEAETRIVLARTALRLSDAVGARALLAEAAQALRGGPDAVVLHAWLEESRAASDAASGAAVGRGWCLTTAELRVLQLLPTHLSFPEIAKRLYVSSNTVKTHARALYRKLDACSRAEAVAHALDAGLLGETASH